MAIQPIHLLFKPPFFDNLVCHHWEDCSIRWLQTVAVALIKSLPEQIWILESFYSFLIAHYWLPFWLQTTDAALLKPPVPLTISPPPLSTLHGAHSFYNTRWAFRLSRFQLSRCFLKSRKVIFAFQVPAPQCFHCLGLSHGLLGLEVHHHHHCQRCLLTMSSYFSIGGRFHKPLSLKN